MACIDAEAFEGLRPLLAVLDPGDGLAWEKEVRSLYEGCLGALEAGSASRITTLPGQLAGMGAIMAHPDF
jgi:hypothetical protein